MALVSGSVAWTLLVRSGYQVGESKRMWVVLDGNARILSAEQVQELDTALKALLAEEDEQALINLAMAEEPGNLLHTSKWIAAKPEEWTIGDSEPEEHWSKWSKKWERPESEINLELYWIKQHMQQFIQKVAESESALLIIA